MVCALPSNEELESFSTAVPWRQIEEVKERFNQRLSELADVATYESLPLEDLSRAADIPITLFHNSTQLGNSIIGEINGRRLLLASFVSARFRNQPLLKHVTPFNLNPSVNHTNLDDADSAWTKLRALGAELELGLFCADGSSPSEEQVQQFISTYRAHAYQLGITPQVDREACMYQVEVHVAPGIGYHRTRRSLDGILQSLVVAASATNLHTAIMSAYPIESDFKLANDPKVRTAVDVMQEVNRAYPSYIDRLRAAHHRFHMDPISNFVETFRLQGCHVHLDIAGRSEALGLFAFHTLLHSATMIANKAVLKGGPFVNGTCDIELLCAREHLRQTTVTGRYLDMPLSPHFSANGMERYTRLLQTDRANAVARALLHDESLEPPVSVMHNPIGRIRPELDGAKRICTIESTGLPVNISASRQAAILTDLEFTYALVEDYFRRHGTDLSPLAQDVDLLTIVGPLSASTYRNLQDQSDHCGTDLMLETAAGNRMPLHEFYELKRNTMHQRLIDIVDVRPRDIDDVYMSLQRMLNPPSGRVATTPEHYINDSARRSTGNWGMILRQAFLEEGGVPGAHCPDAVLRVANRVHRALEQRYSSEMPD